MAEFRVRLHLEGLPAVRAAIYQQVYPLLTEAVSAIAQQTSLNWQAAIQDAKLWVGEKDAYAASIQVKMTGAFSALVWSDYRYAEEIEKGRPARDLKKMLDTSLKVRTGKRGQRYMIIPFRHNTPGQSATGPSMPEHVYAKAKKLAPSSVTGMGSRLSGTGAMDIKTREFLTVPQRTYKWGGRLPPGSMGPNPRGKVDRFAGMVRFQEPDKKPRYSQYMTFRVMSENSKGWIIPPRPGLNIVQQVVSDMQPVAEEIFREAVRRST
jgi:hypothetical protein